MTLLRPVNKDCRGYTNCFKCIACKALIYTASYCKELEYNYCPYCAEPVADDSQKGTCYTCKHRASYPRGQACQECGKEFSKYGKEFSKYEEG